MFRFYSPYMFYLLIAVVLSVALFVFSVRSRKRRLARFGNVRTLQTLMPYVSSFRPQLKFYIVIAALVLIVFALARPQFGTKLETHKSSGVEAMIVLDVSNSMLANDVLPNRLDNAKMMMSKMIDNMPDDKVGLIVFAGDAFIQLPLTADNVSAKMFLSSINTGMIPIPGTAIGTALDLAIRSFGDRQSDAGRTIILLTDGENHEDDAIATAKLAKERGIIVNVVGFGSPQGSPIPVDGTMSFRKDSKGNVVVTKLNEQMCSKIAEAGAGVYVRADNSGLALKAIFAAIEKMQKGETQSSAYSAYDEKFHVFAWIALFLVVLESFILNRQNKQLNKIKWF